jgi:hypothetical protein
MLRRLASLLVFAVLIAPSLAGADRPRTVLDQQTGSTLVIATQAWTFAREQLHLAAHARDYIGIQAVEINTAGKRSQFLAVFFWSTIDRRGDYAGEMPRIELSVDDRRVLLSPSAATPREVGISQWPLPPPGKAARLFVYPADPTLLRQIAESHLITLRLPDDRDGDLEPIATWKDGRAALRDFLAEIMS